MKRTNKKKLVRKTAAKKGNMIILYNRECHGTGSNGDCGCH